MRAMVLLLSVFVASVAWAHESRPIYLQFEEIAPNNYLLQWKLPQSLSELHWPQLLLPRDCTLISQQSLSLESAHQRVQTALCENPLPGRQLALNFVRNPSLALLVQVKLLNGQHYGQLLKPGQSHWQLLTAETPSIVAKQYLLLGMAHIWSGIDHLLFVACLLFIAGTPRRLLITLTGFTLAHSLTLVAASLNWFRLPVAPVEAVIALSIVFLATEIARPMHQSWTWRYPLSVSVSFGLLHGFGFAAVLDETGLPQTQLPLALFHFNLGVELGQLLFVAACMSTFFLGRVLLVHRFDVDWPRVASYGVGGLASFWLFDRLAALVA